MKVLISGDVVGHIDDLYTRVKSILSKSGSFDCIFCVGEFSAADREAELAKYLSGEAEPVLPTYFFEPGSSKALAPKLSQHETDVIEVAKNLYYLGRGGIKTVKKLTVAFLARDHTSQDMEGLKKVCMRPFYFGADFLLTTDWPQGAEVDLPAASFEELKKMGVHVAAAGHPDNTAAALAAKPRYHFAATRDAFFQRLPYRLPEPPPPGQKGVVFTRFVALATVGNPDKKRRWMHALSVEPVTHVAADVLTAQPAGTTECPYVMRRVMAGGNGTGGRGKRGAVAANVNGPAGKRARDDGWAERISEEEAGRRADSGMFFFADRSGRGGGRGSGRGGGPGGGYQQEPVNPTNTRLFVGNLPSCEPRDLESVFSRIGPLVAPPHLIVDKSFGFVEFLRHDDAARAIQTLHGYELRGNRLTVNWSKAPPRRPGDDSDGSRGGRGGSGGAGGAGGQSGVDCGGGGGDRRQRYPVEEPEPPADPNNTTVFVGNLKKDAPPTVPDVREAFVTAGCRLADIVDIRVAGDRGYAFVELGTHAAAAAAIAACDGAPIGATRMRCNWSRGVSASKGGAAGGGAGGASAAGGAAGGVNGAAPAAGGAGRPGMRYPVDPRQACWFCLASPEVEDHLIVSIGDNVYLAVPKGFLSPDHVVIVPVAHTARYSELAPEAAEEVERFKAALRDYYASQGAEAFVFERCVKTQGAYHLHIQVLPVPRGEVADGARMLLKVEGHRVGLKFEDVPADADLRQALLPQRAPQYFYAEVPGDQPGSVVRRLAVADEVSAAAAASGGGGGGGGRGSVVPVQFGRTVAAKLLGVPELAHWKACPTSKELETRTTHALKAAFRPFDFTLA